MYQVALCTYSDRRACRPLCTLCTLQVTTYNRINKQTDSVNEKFALYFGASMFLYPASRFFAMVEAFAPLWLGGHIVGFGSFFVWTLNTESDLLKSDAVLLKAQAQEGK